MASMKTHSNPISHVEADHVAVALERMREGWIRYAGDLGGRWVNGGPSVGFDASTFRFAAGLKVEVLQPYAVEQNDFLRRFLDRSGPGVHHLTYKVPDLAAALTQVESAGYQPIGVSLDSSVWREAFLHPKATHGILVQLAQAGPEFTYAQPPSTLPPIRERPAELRHFGHVVQSLDDARSLFVDLLGGEEDSADAVEGGRFVDIVWQEDRCIRFLQPSDERGALGSWLGARPGRAHHLAFALDAPQAVPNSRPRADGCWEVPPYDNHGVRLHLSHLD